MANLGFQQLRPEDILTFSPTEETANLSVDGIEFPRDTWWPKIQIKKITSNELTVPRVDTLATAAPLGNDVTTPTDQSDTTLVTPPFGITLTSYVSDVLLSGYGKELLSGFIEQLKYQIQFKKIAIVKQVLNDLYIPSAGAQILGLPDLNSQTFGALGAFNPDFFDDAIYAVKGRYNEKTEKFAIMHSNMEKELYRTMRTQGWTPQYATINGNRYLLWDGVVCLPSDYVPITDGPGANETSIWVVANGYESTGFFFACPANVGDNGWVIEKVQLGQNLDLCIYRIKWYLQSVLTQITGLARYSQIVL